MEKKLIIVFDADNTIWDTDAIFRGAQLTMLRVLAESGRIENPDAELNTLRTIDSQLGKQLGEFEYDFKLLAIAILDYFSCRDPVVEDSIHKTLAGSYKLSSRLDTIVNKAHISFQQSLRKIPELYPDTLFVLSYLKTQHDKGLPVATILFSEGDANRLKRILHAHKIIEKGLFNEIIIKQKNKESFESLKRIGITFINAGSDGAEKQFIMIGDNLERDIKYANQAGFTTVYKPSLYKGLEKIHEPIERPDYKIDVLQELLEILNKIYTYPIFDMSSSK